MSSDALKWGPWKSPDKPDPYVDWLDLGSEPLPQRQTARFVVETVADKEAIREVSAFAKYVDEDRSFVEANDFTAALRQFDQTEVPVPEFALRKVEGDTADGNVAADYGLSFPPPDNLLPGNVPDDTVIAGVIDIGIPLGHNRFRMEDGSSRILSAWQNLADWDERNGQTYLPYGREFYRDEIDALLRKHSGGDLKGWLDEESFNRETGVVNMHRRWGNREAAGGAAHGAHVLDLAAGSDPENPDEAEFRKRVKIIAVNVPDNRIMGASGTYLDGFLIQAIKRIIMVSDMIWAKNHPEEVKNKRLPDSVGYPIVFNISFGKQAGSKTSLDRFPAAIKNIIDLREPADRQSEASSLKPIDFVMPAGNSNLSRSNAFLEPKKGEELSLDWRIQPEDQSSNFVEIWTSPAKAHDSCFKDEIKTDGVPLEIAVVPPGVAPSKVTPVKSKAGEVSVLSNDLGAIYCNVVDGSDGQGCLVRHVVCIAPTLRPDDPRPAAPAGVWTIKVKNASKVGRVQCVLSVQTDQALRPGRPVNRHSYFDDKDYQVYDDNGRVIASYDYPPPDKDRSKNRDDRKGRRSPVRRHGTMNASAAHRYVGRVGGYRVSDGKFADYSSTGRGRAEGQDDLTEVKVNRRDSSGAPTAAMPTEDGPAHFGILAAGAANGSVAAMRGTSFAAPQAARKVILELLAGTFPTRSEKHRLYEAAKKSETDDEMRRASRRRAHAGRRDVAVTEAMGRGRIESPVKPRVSRTGREHEVEDDPLT